MNGAQHAIWWSLAFCRPVEGLFRRSRRQARCRVAFSGKKGGASENVKTDFSFPAGENKYL